MEQGWLETRGHLNGLAPERQAALSGEYPRKNADPMDGGDA